MKMILNDDIHNCGCKKYWMGMKTNALLKESHPQGSEAVGGAQLIVPLPHMLLQRATCYCPVMSTTFLKTAYNTGGKLCSAIHSQHTGGPVMEYPDSA